MSRVRPRKQDAVGTMGTMEYRGAVEFRAHVSLVFLAFFSLPGRTQENGRATGGVPNKRNSNNTTATTTTAPPTHAPSKVHTPHPHQGTYLGYVRHVPHGSPHPGRNNGNGTCNRDRRKTGRAELREITLTEADNTFWVTTGASQKGFT